MIFYAEPGIVPVIRTTPGKNSYLVSSDGTEVFRSIRVRNLVIPIFGVSVSSESESGYDVVAEAINERIAALFESAQKDGLDTQDYEIQVVFTHMKESWVFLGMALIPRSQSVTSTEVLNVLDFLRENPTRNALKMRERFSVPSS